MEVRVVGCYSLDVYCACHGQIDGYYPESNPSTAIIRDGMGQWQGRTQTGCLRQARRDGWVLYKRNDDWIVKCPKCKAGMTAQPGKEG